MTTTTTSGPRAMYLPSEVASYLRAASPARTWMPTSRQVYGWIRRGLLAPGFQNAPQGSIVIDFDDLIAGQAISSLRAADVPLGAIVEAAEFFSDLYGVDRPYAHRQFWISGHDIFGKPGVLLIAGTRGGQLALPLLVDRPRLIATSLAFDIRTSRPISWSPRAHVELRPSLQSGQPCVRGTSILTTSVWRYSRGSDTLRQIAWRLGIDQADAEGALAWEHARAYRSGSVA